MRVEQNCLCPAKILRFEHPRSIIDSLTETEHKCDSPNWHSECGEFQSMLYIVEHCPLTKLNGGLECLNTACNEAVAWLGKRRIR